jgi:alanine racemase
MDMLMVDVTEIDCTEGDSVIVLWKPNCLQKQKKLNTIPYEVLTVYQRVKAGVLSIKNLEPFRICILDNSK